MATPSDSLLVKYIIDAEEYYEVAKMFTRVHTMLVESECFVPSFSTRPFASKFCWKIFH